jgi:PEP-CTERM motif
MARWKISFVLTVISATFFSVGTLQPGYAMSFGKHSNGGESANQSSAHGNGDSGNGKGNGNGNKDLTYGNSLDAQSYQVPVPEPATVVLLASGVLGLALWRWRNHCKGCGRHGKKWRVRPT